MAAGVKALELAQETWRARAVLVIFSLALLIPFPSPARADDEDCAIAPPFHHIPGTYTVTGIFDVHKGANCSEVNENGFAMMTSAIHTIRLLNDAQYIPGVDIGLLVYDSCSKPGESQKAVVHSHVMNECTLSVSLGILTTARIAEELRNLSQALQLNLSVVPEPRDSQVLIDSTVELLGVLGRKVVDVVISDDAGFSENLVHQITKEKICVKKTVDFDGAKDVKEVPEDGFLIIVGSAQSIQSRLKDLPKLNNCILIPITGRLNISQVAFIKNHHIMSIENSLFRVRSTNNSRTHRDVGSESELAELKDSEGSETSEDHSELPGTINDLQTVSDKGTGSVSPDAGNSKQLKFKEILSKSEINKGEKLKILFELLHNGGMKNLDDIIEVEEEQDVGTTVSLLERDVSSENTEKLSNGDHRKELETDRKSLGVDPKSLEEEQESSTNDAQKSTDVDDQKLSEFDSSKSIENNERSSSEVVDQKSQDTSDRKSSEVDEIQPEVVGGESTDKNDHKSSEVDDRKLSEEGSGKYTEEEEGESLDSTVYREAVKPRIYYINTIRMEKPPEVVNPINSDRAGKSLSDQEVPNGKDIHLEITAESNGTAFSAKPVISADSQVEEDQLAQETVDSPSVVLPPGEISTREETPKPAKELTEVGGGKVMTPATKTVQDQEVTTVREEDLIPESSTSVELINLETTVMTTLDDKEYIEDSPVESVNTVYTPDPADKFRAFFSEETELIKINLGLIRVAETIIKMIEQFKMDFNINCFYETHNSSCVGGAKSDRSLVTADRLEDEIANVARLLKLEKNVLINGLNVESAYGDILFEFNFDAQNNEWYMSKNNKEIRPNSTSHSICSVTNCSECVNFYKVEAFASGKRILEFFRRLSVKTDVYVIVLLTISAIGIILSVCIGAFIIVRILKQDILEGNPLLTMILLVSVIFTYCSVLPFVLKVTDESELAYSTLPNAEEVFIFHKSSESSLWIENILCLTKIIMMSTSFNLLFGIILARSLMLSNCDRDGSFMSHIDGYIQVTLLFFILLVQVCVNIELYIFNTRYDLKICVENSNLSLYFQIYNTFLLILCLITVPFIYKSKRNYNEGLYLTLVVVFLSIIWFIWISIYQFYDAESTGIKNIKEMTALSGLVASATGVLILIFIPRTYLMLTGIVRDNITASLPTLGYTNSSSVLDITQYRSTQALYDTVGQVNTIKSGQMNPNYYLERPTTPSTSKLEPTTSRTPENTYERYGTPPSPLRVTRF